MIVKIKCPKCKREMLFESRTNNISKAYKKCVYCNHKIRVKECLVR